MGKDAKAMLWDLNDGKHLYTLDHQDTINALTFSPNRYWLCAATGPSIKVWDLESKNMGRSCALRFLDPRVLNLLSASRWHGQLMAKPCSLATATAWSGCGRFPKSGPARGFCMSPNSQ